MPPLSFKADLELECFTFSVDQCRVAIVAYMGESIFAAALMRVDLLFDPPASMLV